MIPKVTIGQARIRAEAAALEAQAVEAREREVAARMVVHRKVAEARKEREAKRMDLYRKRALIDAELRDLQTHAAGTDTALARAVLFELWKRGPERAHTQRLFERIPPEPPEVTAERRRLLVDAS